MLSSSATVSGKEGKPELIMVEGVERFLGPEDELTEEILTQE